MFSSRTVSLAARPAAALRLRAFSDWSAVPVAPPDAILGLTAAFKADKTKGKMNLGAGAYRDDKGQPYVLSCVREAEDRLYKQNLDMEYAPIDGLPEFRQAALELALGKDAEPIKSGRVAATQSVSGTGALRLAGEYLRRFNKASKDIYLPSPSWGNHKPIFTDSGLTVKSYRYYDPATCALDHAGMRDDLEAIPAGSIVLYHACAHNPTGVDPSPEQWKEFSRISKGRGHTVLIDMAYQGFASGDPERDSTALRTFIGDGHKAVVCQSFAKNFGLYGHRTGMMSVFTGSADEANAVSSQLKVIVRPMYSNPPIHGARVVAEVLNDAALSKQWRKEVKVMADRIIDARAALRGHLERLGSKRNWEHVTSQIGMFCYTGLTSAEVDRLREDYGIYMTSDGRVSMASVTSGNVERLAESIFKVVG